MIFYIYNHTVIKRFSVDTEKKAFTTYTFFYF